MSTVHDWSVRGTSEQQVPGDDGPSGPYGPGPAGEEPRRPWWRRRGLALVAGAGVILAAATAATAGSLLTARPAPVLTTAQIAAKVDPALVNITSTLGYQGATSAGTGMVLTSSGLVLTNNHVIAGATSITAADVGNHRAYTAVVVGYDERHDIAVLRLRGASGLATVTMANTSAMPGDRVVALGNADGRGGLPAVATGRVTAIGQSINAANESSGTSEQLTGMIRTDAAIVAGYSGGPLVNTAGEVIGMNTAGSADGGSGQSSAQSYAIPADQAGAVAEQIRTGQSSDTVHIGPTAFLGVSVLPGSSAGAVVARVQDGSPAAAAGLTAGDVITFIGGKAVNAPADVRDALVTRHPGDVISISWTDQAGQSHTASVALATGPAG